MAGYSAQVQLADIIVRFESDRECDICELKSFFKYHLIDSTDESDCTVVLKRQASFHMPKDAEMLWQSQRHGEAEPERRLGRRRVSVPSKQNTNGLASCYFSRARAEYYYGLMLDQSWLCYRPSEHIIYHILHQPPQRKNKAVGTEVSNPLNAMPLLIHVITTVHGRYLAHGAAVAIDHKASLFLGRSGSGKSTLSTDLARQKASFMGDDLVLLYTKDGVPMVGSLLLQAKLYMDKADEKSSVDVPAELQTDYCLTAPLEAVYAVQQSGLPTSSVEPRPATELLQQLMEASNGMMMQYDRQQWLATMYAISEQTPYYVLHYGARSSLTTSLLKYR